MCDVGLQYLMAAKCSLLTPNNPKSVSTGTREPAIRIPVVQGMCEEKPTALLPYGGSLARRGPGLPLPKASFSLSWQLRYTDL